MNQTAEEKVIAEAVLDARKVQEFIFGDRTEENKIFPIDNWLSLFQKRLDCIAKIDINNPSAHVELRKRILQQAALSIRALIVLQNNPTLLQSKISEDRW